MPWENFQEFGTWYAYDDGIEHSVWLTQMRDRLQILHRLLKDSGTLFVHIDDNELGYLIVLLDEIFGRSNRLYVVTFKQGSATGHKSINPGCVSTTNFLLIYAKRKEEWCPNRVFTARDRDTRYNQFIVNVNEHHTKWRIVTLAKAFSEHLTDDYFPCCRASGGGSVCTRRAANATKSPPTTTPKRISTSTWPPPGSSARNALPSSAPSTAAAN